MKLQELCDFLNRAAERYPRLIATLARHRIACDLVELSGLPVLPEWEPPARAAPVFYPSGPNLGDPRVGLIDLLSPLCDDATARYTDYIEVLCDAGGKVTFSLYSARR